VPGLESIIGGLLGQAGGAGGAGGGGPQLGKLVEQFEASGLGDKIQSWIGGGANAPVSGAEVKEALGQDQVQSMAQEVGLDTDQAADEIAQKLPEAVDQATPDGSLPDISA